MNHMSAGALDLIIARVEWMEGCGWKDPTSDWCGKPVYDVKHFSYFFFFLHIFYKLVFSYKSKLSILIMLSSSISGINRSQTSQTVFPSSSETVSR